MEERLQKVIAESGYTSRRKAEELILQGKVSVNGQIINTLGTKVKKSDTIIIDGVAISKTEKEYYLLNKPRGVVSTSSDDKKRKTVVDIIETDKRVFPVGRLDYDTTGIILLTNDGELTNILTHPNNNVPKTYLAKLDRIINMDDFYEIKKGVSIDGATLKVSHLKLKRVDKNKNTCFVELTICEGRNHIVKKLFNNLGYNVDKLTRTHYGKLSLGTLLSGEYRTLTKKEIHELYSYRRNNDCSN